MFGAEYRRCVDFSIASARNTTQLLLRGAGFKNEAELDPVVWKWLVGQRSKWFPVMPVSALRQHRGAQQLYMFAIKRAMRLWEGTGHKCEGHGRIPFVDIPLSGKAGLDEQPRGAQEQESERLGEGGARVDCRCADRLAGTQGQTGAV
jgi:hypothetical protein